MSLGRNLGATALVLGVGAAFMGDPGSGEGHSVDVAELATLIGSQKDHVSARQLAAWIRSGKSNLRVIDVRSAEEFAKFSIPTAQSVPISAIPRAQFREEDLVVLYSEGGAHAAQAWVLLKAMGVGNVYFVAGGLSDWFDEVLYPVLPADADGADRIAFAEAAELSRFFGGSPRSAAAGETAPGRLGESSETDLDAIIARARRRGC